MNRHSRLFCIAAAIMLSVTCITAVAETSPEDTEQGLEEIMPLLEVADMDGEEGMSLEEMTDAFEASSMSEYFDSSTGFSMQYPSVFLFDEDLSGNYAATADRKATLSIDHMDNRGGLDEETLKQAIRFEIPDAEILKNEQNGCLRTDRITDEGRTGQTDLYLLTKHSFHHIIIRYPAEEQETYFAYVEYMINTMETDETDIG